MAKARPVDTWKLKSWYAVYAPEMFESKQIGEVPAEEDSKLMNRVLHVTLSELTGDMTHTYTTLAFRVDRVQGKSAFTKVIGHNLSSSYLRSLVRRRRDVIDEVVDVTTKDGMGVRIKAVIYTSRRVSTPGRAAMRNAAHAEILARAREMEFPTLEQEIVFGKFSGRVYKAVKRIAPVKRVEIRKTEVKESFAA